MNKSQVFPLSDDIILNSYYVIEYFHKQKKNISLVKLQNFLFLLEAFYISVLDKELFDTGWYLEKNGAVSKELDEHYQHWYYGDIVLNNDQKQKIDEFSKHPNMNRLLIETIYRVFGELETFSYVFIVKKIFPYVSKNSDKDDDFSLRIDKDKMGKWYKDKFLVKDDSDTQEKEKQIKLQ